MDNWTPEQEKECARLWCVEGLPYRDIAYRIDRKKSSVFRCIKRLGLKGCKGDLMAFEGLYGGEAVSMPFRPIRLNVEPPRRITADQIDAISFHWSDVHFPFQDQRVLDIMYQLILEIQPNIVVDHGDLLDFWQLSTHRPPEEKKLTYWQIDLQETVNQAGQHLATVASLSQQDRRIWKMGNHEDRWNRVLAAMQQDYKIRHILALDKIKEVLTLDHILGLDSLGYESYPYIGGEAVKLFDRLVLTHGHVATKWAAKAMLTTYGCSVMHGHVHRNQVYCNRTMKGTEAGFSLPCCCTLDVHYTPMTDWQQGFAVVHWHKDADRGWLYNVNTVMVHDGVAVYNGKVYK